MATPQDKIQNVILCEDIRDERSGTETLVGVLPDNVAIRGPRGVMPKLAVYLRIQIDDAVDVRG